MTFRKKLYADLEILQEDLDEWLNIIMMNAHNRVRYAVEELLLKLLDMERIIGRKSP